MTSIQPAVRLSDRTAAFIQRPRSIQRHRGPRAHERHQTGMVPRSRREEGVEKFIQNIGTRACSFPSTSSLSRVRSSLYSPSSRLHRPVIPPPNPSHPVAMAPSWTRGAAPLGDVSDSSPTRAHPPLFWCFSDGVFWSHFCADQWEEGGRSCVESLDQVKVSTPHLVPPPACTHWRPAAAPVYPNRCPISAAGVWCAMVFLDFSTSDQRHPPVREHTCVGRVEIADNRLSESPSLHSPILCPRSPCIFFWFRLCIVFGVMIVLARTPPHIWFWFVQFIF